MAVIIPPRNDIFTPDGVPTLRFYEFLRDLSNQSNSAQVAIDSTTENSALALIFDLRQQVGSGEPLTWDETGFTWDLTTLSFDQTEA